MTLAQFPLAADLADRVRAAQSGDSTATECLLDQFRPLLRSRMHYLWGVIRENFSTLEFADVESQVTFMFLSRLHTFRAEEGVYFPHYAEKMLDLDTRAWLRQQRRGQAVPFSQLGFSSSDEEPTDPSEWLLDPESFEESSNVENQIALRSALDHLDPIQRDLVWKCCVLGRTENSVAEEMELSRSAVRNRLENAICALRAYLGETGNLTRTGRTSNRSKPLNPQEVFWDFLLKMAKDDNRPDLVGVGSGRPILLQGTFDFPATGIKNPELLSKKLTYTVPIGSVLGIRYLRVGSLSDGMVAVYTIVNGMPHRMVPCAAHGAMHVSFAIVDPIPAGSQIEIHIASECEGTAVIDCGCLQMPA